MLAEPGPNALESGPLRDLLDGRGEGVFGLSLRGPAGAPPLALSRQFTHGATFEIEPTQPQ